MVALREYESSNVVDIFDSEVYEVYKSFLSMHAINSLATEKNYDIRVREFFQLILGKKVEFLTADEIRSIKKRVVQMEYIDKLILRGNSFNTIETKLNSVASFYGELMANDIMVNPKTLKSNLPKDVTHHDALTKEELDSLFEFMKNEKELGIQKYLLVKMLFTTANRKTATVGLTSECGMSWNENFISRRDVNTGEDIVVVRVMDKGNKWSEKPISDEFYEELQQINDGREHVFSMNPKTLSRSLERFSKKLGRKITPHSLKATAITYGYAMTRDIELCRQLGGHKSITTTEGYLNEEKSLVNQLSYRSSKPMDFSRLNELTHDELKELIKQNDDLKILLLSKIVEPCQ